MLGSHINEKLPDAVRAGSFFIGYDAEGIR